MDMRIRVRADTGANWTSANPILGLDELAYDRTAKVFKIGDGTTRWNALPDVRLSPPVGTESDGSISLQTDNGLHKLTLRASGTPPIVELDGVSILYDMQDLQDIVEQVESDVDSVNAIKTAIDGIYTNAVNLKEECDTTLETAQGAATAVTNLVQTATTKADAASQSEANALLSAQASANSSVQASDVLSQVRNIAAGAAFSRLDKIVSGDFDVVTKKKSLVRSNLNKIIMATGINGAKLMIPPDLVLGTDPGIAIMEIHNIGSENISVEPVAGFTGAVMPRYIQRWVTGGSILLANVPEGDKTISIGMTGVPAVAAGGMFTFFLCVNNKYFSTGQVNIPTARWTAGLTGNLTPRIVTGMPTQKSGAAHLFSFEYKLPDSFPGGTLNAEIVVHANSCAWDLQAILLDNVDQLDSTPVWAGDNVSRTPNHPVTLTTVGANVIMFNFASRVYVTGSAPTQQAANAVATIWSNSFADNIDEVYNSHVSMLGYDLIETAGTSKTYSPNMGKTIQCQDSAIAYRGLSGTPVPGSTFAPAGAFTLLPNKMVEVLCDPAAPTVYHIRG